MLDLINHGEAKFSKDTKTVKAIIEKYESKKKKDNLDEEMRKQIIKEAKGNKESLENKIRSLEANIQLLENNDLLHNTSKLDSSTIQKEVVDENIRNSRIKEIKHTKNLLEKKLKTIDNHIDGLINEENLNSKKKLDIKKFLDNFEADKIKTEKQVKKWEKDNVDRGQRIKDNQINQEKKIKEITEKQIEKVKFETEKKRTLAKQREDELNSKNKAKRKVLENERNDWKVKVEDLKVQIKEAPYKIDIPKIDKQKLSTNELKYIYELKEEKFNEEKKKLEEEKAVFIKNELLNKKKFFKPIQREELDEFKKKTDDLKQELIFKLERDRAVIQEDIDSKNQNLPKPESQYYMKAMQQDKEQKENIEKQRLERIYKQMKLKNFAKAVKENIVPTLNEDLKAKAELKKDQLLNPKLYIEHHHTKKKPRVILRKADPKHPHLYGKKDGKWKVDLNKSINTLKRSNSHNKSMRSNTALSRGKDYSKDEKSFAQLNKTSNSAKYSRSRSARKNKKKKKQALPKPPDYLTEMRIKKHNEERSMSRESKKKDLKTLSFYYFLILSEG